MIKILIDMMINEGKIYKLIFDNDLHGHHLDDTLTEEFISCNPAS